MSKKKMCTKCGNEYPSSAKFFYKNSKGKLVSRCKRCYIDSVMAYKATPKGIEAAKRTRRKTKPHLKVARRKRYYNKLPGRLRMIYDNMRHRCNNPKHVAFKYYGAKGITVDFKDFDDFFEYVTQRMKITSIDQLKGKHFHRPDSTKGYAAGNLELLTEPEHYRLHYNLRKKGKQC